MNGLIKVGDNFLLLGGNEKGGSFKYYLMQHLVQKGLESGKLEKGQLVAEICAGKSALALAIVGQEYGLKVRVYVPDFFPSADILKLRDLGSEVVVRESSKLQEILFELEKLHASGEGYWVRQNFNPDGRTAYSALARKVMPDIGLPDSFVCGIGSGITLQSFGLALSEKNPALKLFGIFSDDISGLRPQKMRITFLTYEDLGSRASLEKLLGGSLQLSSLNNDEVSDAKNKLYSLGIKAGDSTAAVYTLMQRNGLRNSLGFGMDGRFIS